MKTIAVLNQKGGVGKTTIAVNLTRSLIKKGYKALLVDSDPQGSARDWNAESGGQVIPVIGLDRPSLDKDIEAVKGNHDYIVIDGAPSITSLAVAALKIADLILIPVQPSPYDIWASSALVDLIKARQEIGNGRPIAAFVISRAIKNTRLGQEVIEALQDYKLPVLHSSTTQRVIYPTTASQGDTVFCGTDTNDAAKEIEAIRDEILGMLK